MWMSNAEHELEVNSVKIVYLLFLFDLEKFIVDTHDLFHLPFLCILSHTYTKTHDCQMYKYQKYIKMLENNTIRHLN